MMKRIGMIAAAMMGLVVSASGPACGGMVVTGNFVGVIDDSARLWNNGTFLLPPDMHVYNGQIQYVTFQIDLDELAAWHSYLEMIGNTSGQWVFTDRFTPSLMYSMTTPHPFDPIITTGSGNFGLITVEGDIISIDLRRSGSGQYVELAGTGRIDRTTGMIVDFSGRAFAGGAYAYAASDIYSVPEPSTLAAGLLGVVLMGGAWLRRWGRQAA